jgi:hypothetical protein
MNALSNSYGTFSELTQPHFPVLQQRASLPFAPADSLSMGIGANALHPNNNPSYSVSSFLPPLQQSPMMATMFSQQREALMRRFNIAMDQSVVTQKALQEWDTEQGLPKSHSQTMVNTGRSRRQLLEGRIIPKWDGTPLLREGESLQTSIRKPRKKSSKTKERKVERS